MSSYPLELSAQEQTRVDGAMCGAETYHKVVDSEAYAEAKRAAGYVWQKTCEGYDYLLTRSENGLDLNRDGKSQLGRSWSVVSTATSIVVSNTPYYVKEAKQMVQSKCLKTPAERKAAEIAVDEVQKVPVVEGVEDVYKVVEETRDVTKPVGLINEGDASSTTVKESKPSTVEDGSRKSVGAVRGVDPAKAHNMAAPVLPGVGRKAAVADSKKMPTSSSSKPASAVAYKSSLRGH